MKKQTIAFILTFVITCVLIFCAWVFTIFSITSSNDTEDKLYLSGMYEGSNGQMVLNWFDHAAIYSDFFKTSKYIKDADILFIGSSRVRQSFFVPIYKEYFGKMGLKQYNLGQEYGEGMRYFLALFDKLDIRNKIIIINIDSFFKDEISQVANNALKGDIFNYLYITSSFYKDLLVDNFFSDINVRKKIYFRKFIESGQKSYDVIGSDIDRAPAFYRESKKHGSIKYDVKFTKKFMSAAKKRNLKVIFTIIPASSAHQNLGYKDLEYLSKIFGVEYFLVESDNLYTSDGSHLTDNDSITFSERSLKYLDNISFFKNLRNNQ